MSNKKPSALDAVNAKRLASVIKKSITNFQQYALDSGLPHDEAKQLLGKASEEFLKELSTKGVIHRYQVVCDARNNTPKTVAQGMLVVDVFFQTPAFKDSSNFNVVSVGNDAGKLSHKALP